MSGVRIAKVTIRPSQSAETVAAYLPQNYRVIGMSGEDVLIGGTDNHGWTMEQYIIPRLGSGLMAVKEIELDLEHIEIIEEDLE